MKKNRTLRWHFILTTFLIFIATGIVSALLLFILSHLPIKWQETNSHWYPLVLVLISSTIIGTFISALVSNHILLPIQQLIEGTKEVSKGNFGISVKNSHKGPKGNEVYELINQFNEMTQALNKVEIIHNDFISNFSHEFKTPIMSIQGFAKQLEKPDLTESERHEFLQVIISETSRLSNLSSNILLLSNLENHEVIRFSPEHYSLAEQLRHCLLILQADWESKELELVLELEEFDFYGDLEMMASLWLNLLHNSIKFSPDKGKLTIKCYRFGQQVKVKIADQGMGMSDSVREHIFDKFYQGELSHQGAGSGLGLSIVKKIADIHHGEIFIKSKVGVGSVFTVVFENDK